jgi:threonine dehydratase
MATMADGIAVPLPGSVPFPLVQRYVDEIRTVSEGSIAKALLLLMERAKVVVEPAGAVGVAALLEEPTAFEPPVAVLLSGGNTDPVLLIRVLLSGLSAAGRYLTLRIPIPDRPGALADLLRVIGAGGGNVMEVDHDRIQPHLGLQQVEVAVTVETRGAAHCEELVDHLTEHGYRVRHS